MTRNAQGLLLAVASTVLLCASVRQQNIVVLGLEQPVEVLRDRWGVPHIYARTEHDLFLAQGYMAAKDRLFQIDLWRRVGTGKLAEVIGPAAIPRDRLARSVRYRGNMEAEWGSYASDTKQIATAFTDGINAYIRSLDRRPIEFRIAGYDPALWVPEDCLARVAGLLMTRNVIREVARAQEALRFGLPTLQKYLTPDPPITLEIPHGLELADITGDILHVYNETVGPAHLTAESGSNNWVVDGAMSETGKPILANDPHRPILIPSLRRTVHLVGPGWNAIGAGEPALPGIALGHNERIAFGFTTVAIDQQDLFVEKLNPSNPDEYRYRGTWSKVEMERQTVRVKGSAQPQTIELRYTIHGPIIHEDRSRQRAYALRWVGMEPGTAGYLAGISLARATNWDEFLQALERYKVPAENIVYADTFGNIGWHATGLTPIRKNWSGLFPVPGDSGEYEWSGFRKMSELPWVFNPPSHYVATANHNILPSGYRIPLGYEWALPYRFERIREMLAEKSKFTIADFERMQLDVTSIPARRFQNVLRRWKPQAGGLEASIVDQLLRWDAKLRADSTPALIFEFWMSKLPLEVFGPALGARVNLETLLESLQADPHPAALASSLQATLRELEERLGRDRSGWRWGRMHQLYLRHPVDSHPFHRGPIPRSGDANTVNAASGTNFTQTNGPSYRQIFDLSNWDNSVMTNVPGESGDPTNPHYSDLLDDWNAGKYHPMPFSRRAVEAAAEERILLTPAATTLTTNPAKALTK